RFWRASRDIRWCWLVHSSVSQSANPTHTMSRPRRFGDPAIGAMIPGAGACSLGSVRPAGDPAAPPELAALRRRFPRVAVVHDWLTVPGGSEQVVLELLRMFPDAELYTSIYDPAPWPPAITQRPVHSSFLNRIPGASGNYQRLLPLMNAAFHSFDLSR